MLLLAACPVGAATVTWDGSGDMTWTQPDTTSWSGATNQISDTVQFLGAGTGTITVQPGGVTAGGIIVSNNTANYTFTGGNIGGSGSLSKYGTNALVFNNTNTYTGATTVNAGILLLDGGIISNNSVLTLGPRGVNNASLVMTNGARFFASGGSHYVGNRSSTDTMTVMGGTATSTFNGGGNTLYVCSSRERTENNNRLTVGANGVVTNVGTLWIGDGGAFSDGNNWTNHLVVTDGGKLLGSSYLYIGVISAGGNDNCNATYNTCLIANGGFVRAGGEVYVGALAPNRSNGNGQYSFNTLTITNGGQLYSGGPTSCIGWVRSTYTTATANSNRVAVAGSLNGTNAMWDLGGKTLYIGYTTNASKAVGNVLGVHADGAATNIGSLIVSASSTMALGPGGRVFANNVTNSGTMTVTLDDSVTPACGVLSVSGNLDVTNAILNIVTNRISGVPYVIASYGTLQGPFLATNGLPETWMVSTN